MSNRVESSVYPDLPEAGPAYTVTARSDRGIVINLGDMMPSGLDWHALTHMQAELPLTSELYSVQTSKNRTSTIGLPTVEALNSFSDRHLQGLGATTMRVAQVAGGDLPAAALVDNFAEGTIPLATDPVYFFHDLTDHMVGAMTLAEPQTEVWQQIARKDQAMRVTDPENASKLAVMMAEAFDRQSSVNARFFKAVRYYREEPMLLSGLHENSVFYGSSVIADAVDAAIDEPPEVEAVELIGDTKLARWAQWEEAVMPAYGASIVAKLSEQPAPAGFGQRVGRLLSRIKSLV